MLVLAEDLYESKWYILRDTKVIISHCTTALTKLYHVYVNLSQKLRKNIDYNINISTLNLNVHKIGRVVNHQYFSL